MFSDKHEIVDVFPTHVEAEQAVLVLQKAGFEMDKISIVGRDYQTTDRAGGFLSWRVRHPEAPVLKKYLTKIIAYYTSHSSTGVI